MIEGSSFVRREANDAGGDDDDVRSTASSAVDVAASAQLPRSQRPASIDDVIDRLGLGRFHVQLAVICGAGWASDNFWMQTTSYIMPRVANEFRAHASLTWLLASAQFSGMALGSVVWGAVGDRFGRSFAFTATLLTSGGFGTLAAFAPDFWTLAALLFLMGFGVGGNLPIDGAMFAEFVPSARRGTLLSALSVTWVVGSLLSASLAWALLPGHSCTPPDAVEPWHAPPSPPSPPSPSPPTPQPTPMPTPAWPCDYRDNLGWRYLVGATGVINLLCVVTRIGFPESPRYLMSRGRLREAHDVLLYIARRTPGGTAQVPASPELLIVTPPPNDDGVGVGAEVGADVDDDVDEFTRRDTIAQAIYEKRRESRRRRRARRRPSAADGALGVGGGLDVAGGGGGGERTPLLNDANSPPSPPPDAGSFASYTSVQAQEAKRASFYNDADDNGDDYDNDDDDDDDDNNNGDAESGGVPRRRTFGEQVRHLFSREWWRTSVLLFIIWPGTGAAYTFFNLFLPTILEKKHFKLSQEYLGTFIYACAGVPGSVLGALIVESPLGRKKTLAASTALAGLGLALFTFLTHAQWQVFLSSSLVNLFAQIMFAALFTYTPEVFPTAVRTTATGICSALAKLSSVLAPPAGAYLLDSLGTNTPLFIAMGIFLGSAVAAALLPRETRGKGLG